jgi:hypothetical protein
MQDPIMVPKTTTVAFFNRQKPVVNQEKWTKTSFWYSTQASVSHEKTITPNSAYLSCLHKLATYHQSISDLTTSRGRHQGLEIS